MIPVSFDESDVAIGAPAGVDENGDNVEALSIARAVTPCGTPVVVSCWKFTAEELAEANRTGRIWLVIVGQSMPPALLQGIKPEFVGVNP